MSEDIKIEVDESKRDARGFFTKGNNFGKLKRGKKNILIEKQREYMEKRIEEGYTYYEVLDKLAHDPTVPPELNFKAAKALQDFALCAEKALIADENDSISGEEMILNVFKFIKKAKGIKEEETE